MTKCKGCGKEYRKGTLVTLLDAESNSGGRSARVCAGCARGGMLVVAPRVATPVKRDAGAVKDPLANKLAAAIRQLRVYSKVSFATAEGHDAEFYRGRAEGLDCAVELLRSLK